MLSYTLALNNKEETESEDTERLTMDLQHTACCIDETVWNFLNFYFIILLNHSCSTFPSFFFFLSPTFNHFSIGHLDLLFLSPLPYTYLSLSFIVGSQFLLLLDLNFPSASHIPPHLVFSSAYPQSLNQLSSSCS